MTSEHPIEGLMLTAMNSIQDMVDVNTIIGEPIETSNNIVIIPISKVSFGFAAGGSEFNEETIDEYIKKEKDMVYINVGSISIPKENNNPTYMMYENRKFTIYDIEENIFDSIEI